MFLLELHPIRSADDLTYPSPKERKNFRTGWSVLYKKKEEAVNASVALQNLAVGLQFYLKETLSLFSFKDFGKFSSNSV